MKGFIFIILMKFIKENYTSFYKDVYSYLTSKNLISFSSIKFYPDDLFTDIFRYLSNISLKSEESLYFEFGKFFVKEVNKKTPFTDFYSDFRSFIFNLTEIHITFSKFLNKNIDNIKIKIPYFKIIETNFGYVFLYYTKKEKKFNPYFVKGLLKGAVEIYKVKCFINLSDISEYKDLDIDLKNLKGVFEIICKK